MEDTSGEGEILSSMDLNSKVFSEILDLNGTIPINPNEVPNLIPGFKICDEENPFQNTFSMLQFENFTMPCFTFPSEPSSPPPVKGPFEFITVGILLTTISVFGLLGNVVAIIVLSRPVMKGSFSTLLIGLSSFDLLYLTIGIAIFGLPALSSRYEEDILPYVSPIGFGIGHIGRVGSVFVTMSVTIERYFAIVHPLKHFSGKRYLLVVPIVSSVLYNIPKFFELQKVEKGGVFYVESTPLRSNKAYVTWYIFWSKFILIEVIPYFTIVILNSAIIRKIWKSNQFRRRFVVNETPQGVNGVQFMMATSNRSANWSHQHTMTNTSAVSSSTAAIKACSNNGHANLQVSQSSMHSQQQQPSDQIEMTARQRREANLGIVLVSISVLFILCQSVKIIPDLYEVVTCRFSLNGPQAEGICNNNPIIDSLIDVSHLLLAINSSVNVIIYTLRGEKFREVLTSTFGLENWLFCWRSPNHLQNSRHGESMGLLPLHRNGSEFVTQILTATTTISGSISIPANAVANGDRTTASNNSAIVDQNQSRVTTFVLDMQADHIEEDQQAIMEEIKTV